MYGRVTINSSRAWSQEFAGRVCVFGVCVLACMHVHTQRGHIAVVSLRQSSLEKMMTTKASRAANSRGTHSDVGCICVQIADWVVRQGDRCQ